MKKKLSIYIDPVNKYKYQYDYETKEYQLYSILNKKHNNSFTAYFKSDTVKFKNQKELKTALYNYQNYNNTKLNFKHYTTHYQEEQYLINKVTKLWTIYYYENKEQTDKEQIKNEYVITNKSTSSLDVTHLYLSQAGIDKLQGAKIEYNYYQSNYFASYPYIIQIYGHSKKEAIKNLEQTLKMFYINNF